MPATLDFKYQAIPGAAPPANQSLQIKSTGAALAFTISPIAQPWLSVSANSGTTPATIKVYVNPTNMASGSYSGAIVVKAPTATTSQSVTFNVTLEISDAPATVIASTAALSFAFVADALVNPAPQPIVLTASGGAVSIATTITGGVWLKAAPSSGIALTGTPLTVMVSVNPATLGPGTYNASIKFTPSTTATRPITVAVTLIITPGVPTITALWPHEGLINSPATYVTITGTNFYGTAAITSSAYIGTLKLTSIVISPTSMLVTMPAAQMTAKGILPIMVKTPTATGDSGTLDFTVISDPEILAVTDAASYALGSVSPGEIITIYGLGLGPANLLTLSGTDPIATSLPSGVTGTSVTIDGVDAPLVYTSADQVSCIVPFTTPSTSGSQVDVVVTYNSAASAAFPVKKVDANPGIFTMNATGSGQGAFLNFNAATGDYIVNGASTQATKGSTVVLYLTGYGATSCVPILDASDAIVSDCTTGATEANLISGKVTPVLAVSVTIDGAGAVATAQAPIGSIPGLMQINAVVPDTAKPGSVPVVVTVGTGAGAATTTQNVTLAVK
ncbi:MAG: IPT/TIG domain-containing protein [Acidobacteriia bacterium]|nr:IPT/TIG domain-containing protein [Terriglobia bacterium]